MSAENHPHENREAVGIFDSQSHRDAAIAELEITAFPRHDISVLGSESELRRRYGTGGVPLHRLEDNAQAPRAVSIRPEEKIIARGFVIGICAYVGGCIVAIAAQTLNPLSLLAAIAAGSLAGAALGGLIAYLFGHYLQKQISRQIQKGGLLLWVRTGDAEKEKIAMKILRKHGARDVHVHGHASLQ
ncbi:MAG: hypothetical protein L6Q57_05065 [Alphaproteobacteria bacterium]|nr:hypothetical protein [Alphaproteobacteria bacterium]